MREARDVIDGASVRNIDEIQERDPGSQPSRAGALVLASLGGACIVFAAVLLLRSPPKAKVQSHDPLGDLGGPRPPARRRRSPSDGVGQDVTFPALLSDAKQPDDGARGDARPEGRRQGAAGGALRGPGRCPSSSRPARRRRPRPRPTASPWSRSPRRTSSRASRRNPPPGDTLATMAKQASRESGGEMAPPAGRAATSSRSARSRRRARPTRSRPRCAGAATRPTWSPRT